MVTEKLSAGDGVALGDRVIGGAGDGLLLSLGDGGTGSAKVSGGRGCWGRMLKTPLKCNGCRW